jgi:transposase
VPGRAKRDGDEALGRGRGGLSTKIHATVDALGHPTRFFLAGGQASELAGADGLLPTLTAPSVIADKGDDAAARVLVPLRAAGKAAVIPPKRKRTVRRNDDRYRYQIRHLIENFFCQLKQYRASATRDDKTKRIFLAAVSRAPAAILLN